jgi:peptidoglycan/xylan/chitin deacetylase (PgdA/CDA1 family)
MSVLSREGFTSLTLREFAEVTGGVRKLPPRAALITFDDGFSDNYSLAWPIAREFGMQLNLFVCTGLIEGENIAAFSDRSGPERLSSEEFPELWRPLGWLQLREMNAAGVDIGFHSHCHDNFGRMYLDDIAFDVSAGASLFKNELGFEPKYFAFPFARNRAVFHD